MPLSGYVSISNSVSMMFEDFWGSTQENFQIYDAFFLLKDLDPVVLSSTRVRFTIPASAAPDGNPGLNFYVTGTGLSSSGGTVSGNVTGFELKRGTSVFLSVSQLDMSYGAFDSWYTSVINALPPGYTGLQPDNDNGLNDDALNAILDLSLDLLGPLEVTGNDDENDISGGAGDDVLNGGGGTDFMSGHEGADQMNGGNGTDIALYAMADEAVWVDLIHQANNRGEAEGDTLTNIEVIFGSRYSDRLYGDNFISTIERFDNLLLGGKGNDKLYGRGGDDVLAGGAGRDVLNGGDGSDWTMYFDSENDGVIVNLTDATENTGIASGDTFVSIENVMGSAHGDHITGNSLTNELHGQDGNDLLFGLGGNDVLYGGNGNDTLNGAGGADTFVYETANEGIDTIVTFDSQDRIELRINTADAPDSSDWAGLAYNLATGALQNPSQQFIINGVASGTGPQFLYDSSTKTLNFDIDGAGAFSAIQLFQITGTANLSASDIYIVTGDFSGF